MTASPHPSRLACLALIGISAIALPPSAHARVTQITITSTESPTYDGRTFGTVGAYERLSGRITGAVDPKDPLNAVIVDIGLAPGTPGLVTYSAASRSCARSTVPKQRRYSTKCQPRPHQRARTVQRQQDVNDHDLRRCRQRLLMNRGFVLCRAAGTRYGRRRRRPSGRPCRSRKSRRLVDAGPVLDNSWSTRTRPLKVVLSYAAAVPTNRAPRSPCAKIPDAPVVVPATDWDFVDANLKAIKLPPAISALPARSGQPHCEFAYVGKDPIVAGLGLAVIRDLAAFLRDAKADDAGGNQLAGDIQYTHHLLVAAVPHHERFRAARLQRLSAPRAAPRPA
jgi:hypothetical protein